MKRFFFLACMALIAADMQAQETYESAELATEDLNGTARYIGMGGAMEALGADISTISTNPAGIGLFRRSWVGASAGLTIQRGDSYNNSVYSDKGKTNADFNQMGAVFAMQTGNNSFFNFGFNYHKRRNFNQILNAMGSLGNSSVSEKAVLAMRSNTWQCNDMDYLVYDNYSNHGVKHMPYGTQFYGMNDNEGYIAEFDFNISGNIKNRLFLGLSVGVHNVNYKSYANYYEDVMYNIARGLDFGETGASAADYNTLTANYPYALETVSYRKITGSGANIKFGAIWRPVETSPFRLGLYIHTPTWYRLTEDVSLDTYTDSDQKTNYLGRSSVGDFRISTPWKFGFSLGHTFSNIVALGATYEYAKYSSINGADDLSNDDKVVNRNTEASLKGVHTLKLGVEVKPVPDVAIRAGYNYQSAIYDSQEGYKDYIEHEYDSDTYGSFYTSNDYTNWGATNRVTFGLGFALTKNLNLDLSYQYAFQKGEYHPYSTTSGKMYQQGDADGKPTGEDQINGTVMQEVKNNRHQLNCTLSYKF